MALGPVADHGSMFEIRHARTMRPKFDSSDGVLILLEPAVCVETMG